MKYIIFLLILLSCSKSHDNKNVSEITIYLSEATKENVRFNGNKFIVSNDGIITLDDAETRYKISSERLPLTEQRRYDFLVAKKYTNNIKIYSPILGFGWDEALDSAIKVWNNQNSAIHFSRSRAGSANITVSVWYEQSSAIAYSYYPYNDGKPGSIIQINTYHNDFSFGSKIYVFTHEMGHTIGFTHTDGTYGTLITGTPLIDSLSIMNTFLQTWSELSFYDSLALKVIYP